MSLLVAILLLATGATSDPPAGTSLLALPGEDPDPSAELTPLAARAIWLSAAHDMDFSDLPDGPADPWLGQDKLLHIGTTFLVTLSTQYFLVEKMRLPSERAWPVAAGTAMSFGLFKELADSQRTRDPLFSWRDMTANALGVGAAVAIILL